MPQADYDKTLRALDDFHRRIVASNERAVLRFARSERKFWPVWYVNVLTRLAVLAGDDDLIYLSSSISEDRLPSGELLALTDLRVIHLELTDETPSAATVRSHTWRRSDLDEVGVRDVDTWPMERTDDKIEHPSWLTLELRYRDRDVVTLPIAERPSPAAYEALADVHKEILGDLTRRAQS